jgi:hypothetical protein
MERIVCSFTGIFTLLLCALVLEAQNFKTVHSFKGGRDGSQPEGWFTADDYGNLYSTTLHSGVGPRDCTDTSGCGTIFVLTPSVVGSVGQAWTTNHHGAEPADE